MTENLVCFMPDCDGILGSETFPLQTGCSSFSPCRACTKCGRMHSYDGYLMFSRPGAAVYLKDDRIENVLEPVSFSQGETYQSGGYLFVCLEGKEDDGVPEMVHLGPNTPITFDGMNEDQMFRFHDECGIKYLLHRGDVNFIEKK